MKYVKKPSRIFFRVEKPPVIEEKPISILNQEIPDSIEFYIEKMNTYKEKNN